MLGMHKSILDTMHQRFSTSELDLNLCLTEAEIIESEIPKADLVQKNPGNSSKNGATAHQETTPAFNFNHSAGTFKKEPGLNLSSNSPGPSKAKNGSPVKKVKKEFSELKFKKKHFQKYKIQFFDIHSSKFPKRNFIFPLHSQKLVTYFDKISTNFTFLFIRGMRTGRTGLNN